MNFNNNLELTQSQKLVMTTQLKQSLNILNMSKLEVEDIILRESEENPLLEIDRSSEVNWEEYIANVEKSAHISKNELSYNLDNHRNLENMIKDSSNIYEHLKLQIGLYKLTNEEIDICEYIIDSLDKDGYLRIDESEIIKLLNIDKQIFDNCLEKIRQLEPSGVGARNLSECLIIQMRNLGLHNEILEEIVNKDLDLVASNKYKDISKKYNVPLKKCIDMINIIKTLNPRPAGSLSIEKSVYIQPDVIVEKIDDEFIVYTNSNDTCRIKINNFYKEVLKNAQSDKDAKDFIKEKLNSATGLIKNIESRKNTVLKIAEEIVKSQEDFFRKGIKYIKPMKMKDIADTLKFHESTISRGVNGKYMLTPFGLFEFKYFFSSSLDKNDGGVISSTSIKKIIQETIKGENKNKPLSDDKISKLLKEKGLNIARRTIAKYREELKIPSSSKRKQY